MRLLTVSTVTYGLVLLIMPLQQPFWLLAVYPLIVLLLAAGVIQTIRMQASSRRRMAVASAVAFACLWLAVGVYRVYPTFGFYGYEMIGDRWLGAPSRGYRSVVVVTNDGSTEALDWLREHANGSVVLSSLDDVSLLTTLNTLRPPPFELRHAAGYDDVALRVVMEDADFLAIRAIDDLPSPFRPYSKYLEEHFESSPVHRIMRGRGIYQMPVIEIYRRIAPR